MNNGNIQVNSLLEEEYRLTEEQKSNYRQDGHILLNNVADTRLIDEFRPVIGAEVKRQDSQSVPLSERGTWKGVHPNLEYLGAQQGSSPLCARTTICSNRGKSDGGGRSPNLP
jgi:hypothetical protein